MLTPSLGHRFLLSCLITLAACQGGGDTSTLATQEQAAALPPGGGGTTPVPVVPLDLSVSSRRMLASSGGQPTSFRLWRSVGVPRSTFFSRFAGSFHLGTSDTMASLSTRTDDRGYAYTRFQLKRSGVPVENAIYALTERSGSVVSGMGRLAPGLTVSTTPTVLEADALTAALADINATTYRWQSDLAFPQPTGLLVIHSPDFGATLPFRLCYRFDVATTLPRWDTIRIYVDAQTSQIVEKNSRLLAIDTPATGKTVDGSSVSFTADLFQSAPFPTLYRLQESGTRKIITLDGDASSGVAPIDFTDSDNAWSETAVRRGVSAHWNAERVWDYLQDTLELPGVDGRGLAGEGITTRNAAASGCGMSSSYWDPATRTVNLCSALNPPGPPDVDLETEAHELGHALEHYVFGGFGTGLESKGLSESIADMFATSVSASASGNPGDWRLFDKAFSAYRRDLQNPKAFNQPDTYKGTYWLEGVAAGTGHQIGGVTNHWFYLLAAGGVGTNDLGTQYNVVGLGRAEAEEIVFHTLLEKLTPNSTFADFREATVLTAGERFGDDSVQQRSVAAAWDAVSLADPSAPDNTKYHLPPSGAQAVAPWPTTLTFETPLYTVCRLTCPTESQWQVQLSDDPTFATHVQTLTASSQMVVGARIVSRAFVNLNPITVYYWRVRSYRGGAWDSTWRFTSSFETSHQSPTQLTPKHASTNIHPWPVTLSWAPVDGAATYRVVVAESADFTTNPQYAYTSDTSLDSLDLESNKQYFWSVMARGTTGNYGTYSTRYHSKDAVLASPDDLERDWTPADTMSFTTSTPKVVFNSPANGAATYPWPVNLGWTQVNGVTGYEVEVSKPDDPSFSPPWRAIQVGPTATHATVNVKPEKNKRYYWRVRGIGPSSEFTPWSNNNAPLTQHFVMNDESTPEPLHPTQGETVNANNVLFQWTPISSATAYQVDVFRVEPGQGAVPVGSFRAPFPSTSFTLAGPLQFPKQHTWTIRAIGPEALDGMTASANASGGFNTSATQSTPTTPCNAAVVAGGNAADEHLFSLGKTSGTFAFAYKTYEVHDRITITYQGATLWTAGCVATPDPTGDTAAAPWTSVSIPFSGNQSQLKVRVEPNCNPNTASPTTQWTYQLSCP
jgi:Zn-dependent metalloprotease